MLGEFLNSINFDKNDIVLSSSDPSYVEKQYPLFPVARTLSYFPECVLIVNEINVRGRKEHRLSNHMHYSFLLEMVPKRKRFTKWTRPKKYDYVDFVMKEYNVSHDKAVEYLEFYTEDDLQKLKDSYNEGGKHG